MGWRAHSTPTGSIVIHRFGIWGIFGEALSNLYRIGENCKVVFIWEKKGTGEKKGTPELGRRREHRNWEQGRRGQEAIGNRQ